MNKAEKYHGCLKQENFGRLDDILDEFKRVERMLAQIENPDTAPWIRDRYHEKLKTLYTPSIKNSVGVLKYCTIESIRECYDILFDYYYNVCDLTEETASDILSDRSLRTFPYYKQFPREFDKRIFSTFFTKKKEYWLDSEEIVCRDKLNLDYYCVYFTKNCSLEEVEWYLEHKLKNELKSNAEKKQHRTNTKSLKQKAFIGILTTYGEKPANIVKFCEKYLPLEERPVYVDVKRIRNRLIKDDWFKEALHEKYSIEKRSEVKKMFDLRNKAFIEIMKHPKGSNGGISLSKEEAKSIQEPRFLKLIFDKKTSLFHVKLFV